MNQQIKSESIIASPNKSLLFPLFLCAAILYMVCPSADHVFKISKKNLEFFFVGNVSFKDKYRTFDPGR